MSERIITYANPAIFPNRFIKLEVWDWSYAFFKIKLAISYWMPMVGTVVNPFMQMKMITPT